MAFWEKRVINRLSARVAKLTFVMTKLAFSLKVKLEEPEHIFSSRLQLFIELLARPSGWIGSTRAALLLLPQWRLIGHNCLTFSFSMSLATTPRSNKSPPPGLRPPTNVMTSSRPRTIFCKRFPKSTGRLQRPSHKLESSRKNKKSWKRDRPTSKTLPRSSRTRRMTSDRKTKALLKLFMLKIG